MTISNLLAFGIFSVSESIAPLVDGPLSFQIILRAFKITLIMSVIAGGIGIVSTGIGFIKKSVPATIVTAVLLSSLFCNIMFNTTSDTNRSDYASIIFMGIVVMAGVVTAVILMKKVNHMEVT
jgi:hypothetical protein